MPVLGANFFSNFGLLILMLLPCLNVSLSRMSSSRVRGFQVQFVGSAIRSLLFVDFLSKFVLLILMSLSCTRF